MTLEQILSRIQEVEAIAAEMRKCRQDVDAAEEQLREATRLQDSAREKYWALVTGYGFEYVRHSSSVIASLKAAAYDAMQKEARP